MRDDEHELMAAVANGESPAIAAIRLGISARRTINLFQKWIDFGLVDADTYELTEEGQARLMAYETGGN